MTRFLCLQACPICFCSFVWFAFDHCLILLLSFCYPLYAAHKDEGNWCKIKNQINLKNKKINQIVLHQTLPPPCSYATPIHTIVFSPRHCLLAKPHSTQTTIYINLPTVPTYVRGGSSSGGRAGCLVTWRLLVDPRLLLAEGWGVLEQGT